MTLTITPNPVNVVNAFSSHAKRDHAEPNSRRDSVGTSEVLGFLQYASKPRRDLLGLIPNLPLVGLQQNHGHYAPAAIVVQVDEVHFADGAGKIVDACVIDASEYRLRGAVTISIRSHFYSLQMHPERLKGHISHFHGETSLFRESSLFKGDTASERRFKSTTDATFCMVRHKPLEQLVYLAPNHARYVEIRSAVKGASAAARIEEPDPKAASQKSPQFSSPPRPPTTN